MSINDNRDYFFGLNSSLTGPTYLKPIEHLRPRTVSAFTPKLNPNLVLKFQNIYYILKEVNIIITFLQSITLIITVRNISVSILSFLTKLTLMFLPP